MNLEGELRAALERARVYGKDSGDEVLAVLRVAGLDASIRRMSHADAEWPEGWCQWPVRSAFREAGCGRSGASGTGSGYGIRLCWQHEDALFTEVLGRLEGNRVIQDDFLRVLIGQIEQLEDARPGWQDAIENALVRRLEDGEWTFSERVEEAVEEYINRRLFEKWGAA